MLTLIVHILKVVITLEFIKRAFKLNYLSPGEMGIAICITLLIALVLCIVLLLSSINLTVAVCVIGVACCTVAFGLIYVLWILLLEYSSTKYWRQSFDDAISHERYATIKHYSRIFKDSYRLRLREDQQDILDVVTAFI